MLAEKNIFLPSFREDREKKRVSWQIGNLIRFDLAVIQKEKTQLSLV